MRFAFLGGGPAGLFCASSLKPRQPEAEVVVFERNKPDDRFGRGAVLSDETLKIPDRNDPASGADIRAHFAYWDDIAVHHQGQKMLSAGLGFCGIGGIQLLIILQQRARQFVWLRTHQKFDDGFTFILSRPARAGSGRMPVRLMTTPRRSSLNAHKIPMTPLVLPIFVRKTVSRFAGRFSKIIPAATAC